MHALSAADLLRVWEHGQPQPLPQRALTLLAAACPESSSEEVADWSVGQRDAALLTLREWSFGPHVTGLATCPDCGERLELTFDVADVRVPLAREPAEIVTLGVEEYQIEARLPSGGDLVAIAGSGDVATAYRELLVRCLVAARRSDTDVPAEQLPAHVVAALAGHLAEADPQADVQIAQVCPECGERWLTTFDIGAFFWQEIDAWADRIVREVHTLASAYGWGEAEILALSPRRRRQYLELVLA
jgi:hypothetical protein